RRRVDHQGGPDSQVTWGRGGYHDRHGVPVQPGGLASAAPRRTGGAVALVKRPGHRFPSPPGERMLVVLNGMAEAMPIFQYEANLYARELDIAKDQVESAARPVAENAPAAGACDLAGTGPDADLWSRGCHHHRPARCFPASVPGRVRAAHGPLGQRQI